MSLEQLISPLSRQEVEAMIYSAIEARGASTTSWAAGSVARAIITGASIVLSAFSYSVAELARSGFLRLSSKAWLTIVAREVYGVERIEATFARGEVTINNTGGGVYSLAAGDLIVRSTSTGKTYRSTQPVSIGALQTGVVVEVEAVEAGSGSSSAPNAIDALETAFPGLGVVASTAFVGQDEESDDQLVERCLGKIASLSPNGPPDAYRFVALSAKTSSGAPAGVTRVATSTDGRGNVSVLLATASGGLLGASGDLSTPLGAVEHAIHTLVEPQAITASVVPAASLEIDVEYTVHVRQTSRTPTQVRDAIDARLALELGRQPIGGSRIVVGSGYVFVDFVEAVIAEEVGSQSLIELTVSNPASDVVVEVDEAPVLGLVSGAVTVVV